MQRLFKRFRNARQNSFSNLEGPTNIGGTDLPTENEAMIGLSIESYVPDEVIQYHIGALYQKSGKSTAASLDEPHESSFPAVVCMADIRFV